MNKRLWLGLLMSMLLFGAVSVTAAQMDAAVRDFMYIGIDPQTLDAGKNSDIYLIRSDGSRIVNLTDTPLDSENKAFWSGDGRHIYFSRNSMARYPTSTDEQSSTSFFVMDVSEAGQNTGEQMLFHLSDLMGQPMRVEDWELSPDQKRIVFLPYDNPDGGTYIVNIDGTGLRERIPKGIVSDYIPLKWSPDSREVA